MRDDREVCGTCRYHKKDVPKDEWLCTNDYSEYKYDYTEYCDVCDEWEKRE